MVAAPVGDKVNEAIYRFHMSSLSVNVMSVGLKVYLSFWFAGGKSNVRKMVMASLSSLMISSSLPFRLLGVIILVATTSTSLRASMRSS